MKPAPASRVATHRTCCLCHRVVPVGKCALGRARCLDRAACRKALARWLARERFVKGAAFYLGERIAGGQ